MGAAGNGVGPRRGGAPVAAPALGEGPAALAGGPAAEPTPPASRGRDGGADRARSSLASSDLGPTDRPSQGALRRYPLAEPWAAEAARPPRLARALPVLAAALGLLAAVLLRGPARAVLPLCLAFVAAGAWWRARRRERGARAREERRSEREILLRPAGLSLRLGGREEPLFDLGAPFGATLFTTRGRERLLVAVSSRAATTFLGARLDAPSRRAHAALLARASVLDGDELLETAGPDGTPLELAAADLVAFYEGLAAIDPGAPERIVLSDGRGHPIVLDGPALRVGDQRFDLLSPIEWRPFLFQETFGASVAVFQATSVRQGAASVVLVALVPSVLGDPTPPTSSGIPELDRALVRDLRLGEAPAGEPPPSEQRVAIDRLFVLPMRSALDRAPRASTHAPRERTA